LTKYLSFLQNIMHLLAPNLRRRSGRQAISNTRSFWENTTIPYTFNVAQTNGYLII